MLERPLPAHLPGGVKHAHLMGLRPPVDTREPCQLQSNLPFCRSTGPPTMSAGPCTGAPRRKLPTGHPSVADRRGTCPPQVLKTQGALGGSRRTAQLHETNLAKSFRRVQGGGKTYRGGGGAEESAAWAILAGGSCRVRIRIPVKRTLTPSAGRLGQCFPSLHSCTIRQPTSVDQRRAAWVAASRLR